MTMGFKLQLLCCKSPHELLQVTLNHLESLKGIVHFSDTVCALIDHASRLAIDVRAPPRECGRIALHHTSSS